MDKPANSAIINVCIIPAEEVGKQCVEISQALKSDSTMFVLDGKSRFAHMTVYMARFAEGQILNVVEVVRGALKSRPSFLCEHTGYFMTSGRYFEASYKKSDAFLDLQERLIQVASDFRLNPGEPYEEGYFTPYTVEQRKNAEETGYDLVYELYRPHITLTRYFEGQVPSQLSGIKPANLSFKLQIVCVYKADDNGAVYEELARFLI